MKKRIFSIVIVLCMVLTFVPTTVFAANETDYNLWVGGTHVTSSTLSGERWAFDPGTYTLTLRSDFASSDTANLQDSTDHAAVIYYAASDHSLTIKLEGDAAIGAAGWENALTSSSKYLYGIYALSSDITITGSHTLDVYGSEDAIWCRSLTVDGTKLNCRSYYTAVKVCSSAKSYFSDSMNGEADMVVKNGAAVFARTTHGTGIHPTTSGNADFWSRFRDCGGGAGIFVNGSLRVENSTVDAENTCYELPAPVTDTWGYNTGCKNGTFCTSICVHDDVVVSGSAARVTGKLENLAEDFERTGTEDTWYSKRGAVMAKNFKVREGGTIEGFITNDHFTQVAQGLRQLHWFTRSLGLHKLLSARFFGNR